MDKQEFINTLAVSLEGIVPNHIINENIKYYSTYITEEIQKGVMEKQVMEELGDPRLIARTIIDASGVEDPIGYAENNWTERKYHEEEQNSKKSHIYFKYYDHSKWYWRLLLTALLLFVGFAVLSIISVVFNGVFYLLSRFMGPIVLIFLVYWFIKRLPR